MVSPILDTVVIDGSGMNFSASSVSVGPVKEGLRTNMGFEVFFWRIWYFLSP